MDELPQGREPETAYYKNLMKDLISKGRSCINKSNWQSCLSKKLDDLYNELLWHPDDELQFSHDGQKIIITNKTLEEKTNGI